MSNHNSNFSIDSCSLEVDDEEMSSMDSGNDTDDDEVSVSASSGSGKVEGPKVRGRKKGQTMKRFFVLAAVKDGEIVMQHHQGETVEDAKKEFVKANNGLVPTAVLNGRGLGYFLVGSKSSKEAQSVVVQEDDNKPTVNVSTEVLARRTANSFRGVYQGWNVTASGLKSITVNGRSYTDDELLQVYIGKPVEGCAKSKPKLSATTLVKRQYIDSLVLSE